MKYPVTIANPFPPIAFCLDGRTTLVYELFIHNNSPVRLALEQVKVAAPGRSGEAIQDWDATAVKANTRYLNGLYRPAETEELLPERIGLAFFWLVFPPEQKVPDRLLHTLTLTTENGGRQEEQAEVAVQARQPLLVQPPVRGASWLAGEAASNTTGHRRTPLFIDGAPYFAQRYAVDWLQLGPDGKLFTGSPEKNEHWYCYGVEVRAVAEGVVCSVQDGIVENVPLSPERAVAINLQSAPGNLVMIDHGGGNFATYAHLLPGSIPVKPGDAVQAGQTIGRLGNSGNSDAPHLHFHIGHRQSPLGTHGVPYHLEAFERLGNIGSTEQLMALLETGAGWRPTGAPELRHAEYMVSNDVLNL